MRSEGWLVILAAMICGGLLAAGMFLVGLELMFG